MGSRQVIHLPGVRHKAPIPAGVRIGNDKEWLAMFPDPEDRPARHAVANERGGEMVVQLEIIAVLPTGDGAA